MKKLIRFGMWMFILTIFLTGNSNATIWYVHPDSSLNSIQTGLDLCSAGDTVLVAPGTYYESIVWPSTPRIKLISEFGPKATIINASATGRAITVIRNLTSATVIDGFTIENGRADGDSTENYGGAIYCQNASATIRNNIINNNIASTRGGGIYCERSNPHILGNVIQENTTSASGGGINCRDSVLALIQENYLYENGATHGGAITCYENSAPNIQYNQILSNEAPYGGGIYCDTYSSPPIHYNNISGNEAWGVYNNGSIWVHAADNWWGHPAGPDSGDGEYGTVDPNPWLTEEIVFDIAADSIVSPPDIVGPGITYTPKILVRNNCNYNYPVTFFTAKCVIDGYQDYVRIDQALLQGATMEASFEDWVVPPQDSVTYLMSISLFYAVDQDTTNDTISRHVFALYTTGVENTESISAPLSFALSQNYPNPFNPQTTIQYTLAEDSRISLVVYNVLGQEIRVLVDEFQTSGVHDVIWEGRGQFGESVSSGIYFYRLSIEGKNLQLSETKNMLLLK